MSETAKLTVEGKTYEFPIVAGTEGEKAIDISNLLKETGYITLDPGSVNTGSCTSAITYMDGEMDPAIPGDPHRATGGTFHLC